MQLGDKVDSHWGRHLIPQIDCNPVVDLTFVGRWIECYLANQVGQKVFQGFSTQRVPALSDAMKKTLDFASVMSPGIEAAVYSASRRQISDTRAFRVRSFVL